MAKDKTTYVCTECGENHPRWLGQCSSCSAWNSITEYKESKVITQRTPSKTAHRGYSKEDAKICKLSEVSDMDLTRFDTGSSEFNRVLGGGIVEGSVILVAGDPGHRGCPACAAPTRGCAGFRSHRQQQHRRLCTPARVRCPAGAGLRRPGAASGFAALSAV